MAVLKILAESEQHPSVEQIYDRMKPDLPMTSLTTVYKTVALLKEMGEVLELGFSDDSNRYDGSRPYPHPHLICIKCRKIWVSGPITNHPSGAICEDCMTAWIRGKQVSQGYHDCFGRATEVCDRLECNYWMLCAYPVME